MTRIAHAVLSTGGRAAGVEHVAAADVMTPADRYGELFVAVQTRRIFADSKSFVDCVPRREPETILRQYRDVHAEEGFDLARFVAQNFVHETPAASDYVSDPAQTMSAHVDGLWSVLTRRPTDHAPLSSLLPLPHDYVVPGGRFGELYYWDSYFTMHGLAASGRKQLLHAMADNFAFIIDTYGHVPNGNRTYYLSRSQPPVFALMTELLDTHGRHPASAYLPQLLREHDYWMDGAAALSPGEAHCHAVCLDDGAVLNRYWDERDTPREEAYLEDVATASGSNRPAGDVYRDLRAGAASGWDFSSRWLDSADDLSSICTTGILPIDLNCFLYALERQIERLSRLRGEEDQVVRFQTLSASRLRAINLHLWDQDVGAFVDHDWRSMRQRAGISLATAVPLYVGLASPEQGHRVALVLSERLLQPGGLATTDQSSDQQWDETNGWAPLQWMAIEGLRRYGHHALAAEIAHRWLATVGALYERQSKLVEKYAVQGHPDDAEGGGGGEYPLQDGFGWTNAVTRRLLSDHPGHHAHQCRAGQVVRRR